MTRVWSKKWPASHVATVNNRHEQPFHAELLKTQPDLACLQLDPTPSFHGSYFKTFFAPSPDSYLKISKWPSLVLQSKHEYQMSLPSNHLLSCGQDLCIWFHIHLYSPFQRKEFMVSLFHLWPNVKLPPADALLQDCIFSSFSTVFSLAACRYV